MPLYRLAMTLVAVLFCVSPLFVSAQDEDKSDAPEGYIHQWFTNIAEAVEESQREDEEKSESGEYIFVYFAGSDWCPHCMRFEKEVINAPTFRRYLEKNFIPVLIDSPRYYTLSEEQKEYNEARLVEYQVNGFPTMVILDSDGEAVSVLGYSREGANGFIKTLKKELP